MKKLKIDTPWFSFNEAAGIHRRKLQNETKRQERSVGRFNEAAGIHRRKPFMERVGPAPDSDMLQ